MANPNDFEGFDLKSLKLKLNEPDPNIQTDPSDIISDTGDPVRVKKSSSRDKSKFAKLEASKLTIDQISGEVQKAFNLKNTDTNPTNISSLTSASRLKSITTSNVSQTVTADKNTLRLWMPKIKNILPIDLYGDKLSTFVGDINQQILSQLDKQRRLSIDQFVRNQAREIVRDKIFLAAHQDTVTFLGQISDNTRRMNIFFDSYVKKYMMTSIELKFKHIFVSQDILKHTKLLIDTISTKLDSVKHNTSLSDVAKISAFGEFKRTLRIKANTMMAEAALAPIKEPLTNLISEVVNQVKKEGTKQLSKYTGTSPIEFDSDNKVQKATKAVRSKVGYGDRSFSSADMAEIQDKANQTGLAQSLESFLSIVSPKKGSVSAKSLSFKGSESSKFDELTKRSIVDIIPSLLAKIHQQVTRSSKILEFTAKTSLDEDKSKFFDQQIATEEIKFDKDSETFVTKSQFSKNLLNKFTNPNQQSETIKPLINQMFLSYKKHGGKKNDFSDNLPNIIRFVTNISKHAKVVKLEHIKKYLSGESLSDFEQAYLDSIFSDIDDSGRKELSKILTKTFFKDESLSKIDTESSTLIGNKLQDIISKKEKDLKDLQKMAKTGDLRDTDFVNEKGEFDHKRIRDIYSDVNSGSLKDGLYLSDEDREKLFKARQEFIKKARGKGGKTRTVILPKGLRGDVDEFTDDTGIPNRDDAQISGPGLYFQGSDKEFHIPFDKISDQAKEVIASIIGKKDALKKGFSDKLTSSGLDKRIADAKEISKSKYSEFSSKKNKMKEDILGRISHLSEDERISRMKEIGQEKYDQIRKYSDKYEDGIKTQYSKLSERSSEYTQKAKDTFDGLNRDKFREYADSAREMGKTQYGKMAEKGAEYKEKAKEKVSEFAEYFKTAKDVGEAQLDALNAILAQLISNQGDTKSSFSLSKLITTPMKFGAKGVGLYLKGARKFYSGLFKVSKVAIGGVPSLLKGGFGLLKGAGGILGKILPSLLSAYSLPYKLGFKALKVGFKLGKKLFTSEKFVDVYIKDKVSPGNPVLKGKDIENGKYSFVSGKKIKDSFSIFEPVVDNETGQLVITEDDITQGLVDSHNKPLINKGSLAKRALKGIGKGIKFAAKGAWFVTKGYFSLSKTILSAMISVIPGLRGLFSRKGKKDQFVDNTSIEELITRHLVKITELLQPISARFGAVREGSYDDYKRDREAENANKKERVKKALAKGKEEKSGISSKAAGGVGVLGAIGSLFGLGGDGKEGEGDGALETAAKVGVGGYALNKIKGLFGKKAVEEVTKGVGKQAVKGVARQGILRGSLATLGRLGVGQAIRTVAVTGATALAGAVSSPVVIGGLAVAGLGAGGYALWNWSKGKDRRKSITEIRNAVYKVPKDKLDTLIDFENDVAKASKDKNKSDFVGSKIKEYIEDFGLDPDDKRQFTFFKHWYATFFFPVFKASSDIIESSFKLDFVDQEKMKDEDINAYKKTIEESSIYQQLKESPFELSKKGFKIWEKENFFKDGEYVDTDKTQKDLDERLDKTAALISDNKSVSSLNFDKMQEKNQAKKDAAWDVYGMPGIDAEANLPAKSKTKLDLGNAGPEKTLEEYQRSYVSIGDNTIVKDKKGKTLATKTWANVEAPIIHQLIKLGWSKEAAIGIAANLFYESGGDHTAVGDGGKAYGLAQWHPDRQELFKKKFGKDIRESSLSEQVAFIDYEMRNGGERKAGKEMMKVTSASEAAGVFVRKFERPADPDGESTKRTAFAVKIEKNYKDLDTDKVKSGEIAPPEVKEQKEQKEVKDEISRPIEKKEGGGFLSSFFGGDKSAKQGLPSSSGSAFDAYGDASVSAADNIPTSTKAAISSGGPIVGGGSSGSSSDEGPSDFDTEADLGDSVAKYESGKKGVASISGGKGDPGGASYGKYQLASRTGTLSRYLKQSGYDKQFAGLSPGSPEFNAKWTELAKSDKAFGDSQHEFIKKTHFDPAIKEAAKLGFDVNNRAIQEAIWSGSIQHGGIKKILADTAGKPGFAQMGAKEQIAAFYQARGDYAAFHMRKNGASEAVIQNASYKRYKDEIKDVMKLADASPDNVKKTEGGLPAASPASQQPIENAPMADIHAKDIKAGLPSGSGPIGSEVPKSQTPIPAGAVPPPPPITDTKPEAPKEAPQNLAQKTAEAALTNTMGDINSGLRAKKDELYNQYRATGMEGGEAARKADTEARKALNMPDYVKQFSSGTINPVNKAPQAQTIQPTAPVQPVQTAQPQSSEITVNDPESGKQTSLLEQQNQLLSQIAGLLGGSKGKEVKAEVASTGDNSAVVSKLDEVIQAIASNSQNVVPLDKQTGLAGTRTVNIPNKGINVGKEAIS